jgi:hypothetical protein
VSAGHGSAGQLHEQDAFPVAAFIDFENVEEIALIAGKDRCSPKPGASGRRQHLQGSVLPDDYQFTLLVDGIREVWLVGQRLSTRP